MITINGGMYSSSFGGLQRYAHEITQEMIQQRPDISVVVPFRQVSLPLDNQVISPSFGMNPWLWSQITLPMAIPASALLWSGIHRTPIATKRQVVTIHDAAVFDHPEYFRRAFVGVYRPLIRALSRRALCLVTVSEFSRARLAQLLEMPATDIRVVPGGVSRAFLSPHSTAARKDHVRDKYGLPSQYVLALGSSDPRKNVASLLSAWASMPTQLRRQFPLVTIGSNSKAFGTPQSGVRALPFIDEEDFPAVLTAASLLVYPSIYEGFGLPPLEALACGTPVLVGPAPVFREFYADGVFHARGPTPSDLQSELVKILRDPELRSSKIASGRWIAERMTWAHAARQTLQILEMYE